MAGQPQRHLLQRGWSVFVSSKRLVAGDAFIFLRGENGELHVGVRRAMRQQANIPSSVISSHNMHIGVLATAWHAYMTGTFFTVYYKPRTSPAEFIVPFDQYMESVKSNYFVGMRFKMRFEGEEAPEQRFTGTIIGIEDADTKRWAESKWRCLKVVRWDENSTIPSPERVSPWKIQPALTTAALNPLPMPRLKRPRSSMVPFSPDSSVLTREVSSKMTIDPSPVNGFSRVLHGQEFSTLRGTYAEIVWPPSLDDEKIDMVSPSQKYGSDKWLSSVRHESTFTDLFSGFEAQTNSSHESIKVNLLDREGKFNFLASNWSVTPSALSLNLLDSIMKAHVQSSDVPYHSRYVRYGVFLASWSKTRAASRKLVEGTTTSIISSYSHSVKMADPRPVLVQQPEVVKPKDGNCRLFGIPLISYHVTTEPAHSHKTTIETDQRSVQIKGVNVADQPLPSVEQEKPSQMCQPLVRDCLRKVQGGSTRNCTKVHKRRIALGRSVDLTKFSNYEELIAELDQLFEFIGELKARNKNWLIVFTDDEGDTMLVGDDPWP
ncbi:hypothetical protein HYC85_030365 [Camellia sinensis]|uniref:Auxin response factor n=1 Tax=Camellia sinensis TaxID=4442 RepID=A0A7J7G4F3_CAMSI|nr:hypothetical protein HYC85_030365 [Camellia sinensis]